MENIKDKLPSIIIGLCILILWEVLTTLFSLPLWVLPAPSAIGRALISNIHLMVGHIGVTLFTTIAGFFFGIVLAFILAVFMDRFSQVKKALYPYIVISQTIPIIFIYPLIMIWFGYGIHVRIIVVTLVCFFPIALNFVDALGAASSELIALFRSMGATSWQLFRMVKFPGAMAGLFSGLKIAATYSVMGAVIGEWLGASHGMGVYMMRAYKSFATDRVFAAIIIVVLLSLLFFQGVKLIEKLSLPWMKRGGFNIHKRGPSEVQSISE